MLIDSIGIKAFANQTILNKNESVSPNELTEQFSGFLKDALNQVNTQEQEVQQLNESFLIGEADVHQVAIASQKAAIGLQLTSQIRNKVIEAYQEIMRMQV